MGLKCTAAAFVFWLAGTAALGIEEQDESTAAIALEKAGGEVIRDEERPGQPVVEVRISVHDFFDNDLAAIKAFRDLKVLKINSAQITDVGLKHIAKSAKLTQLDLSETQITDGGMEWISKLKNLTSLSLYRTPISDEGLAEPT